MWDVVASPIPVYVLVGGAAPTTTQPNVFRDDELLPGEIFILPQDALLVGTTYEIGVTAYAAGAERFSKSWRFTVVGTRGG